MMSLKGVKRGSPKTCSRSYYSLLVPFLGIDYTIGCLPSMDDPFLVIAGKGVYVFLICQQCNGTQI